MKVEERTMQMTAPAGLSSLKLKRATAMFAGAAALAAGVAWLIWAYINISTGGALDGPASEISVELATRGRLLTVAQNLLMVPAAIALWQMSRRISPSFAAFVTVCGILSMSLWSYAAASGRNNGTVETCYLVLSAVWWVGTGTTIYGTRRFYGGFTIILGLFSFWDAVVTGANAPFWLFVTAAPKLPLSWIWNLWTGWMLLRNDGRSAIK